MGFTGWSEGCDRCRKAHTKCDATKPACNRCTSRGLACPGYRKSQGVIFKDVTNSVSTKYGRLKKVKIEKHDLILHKEVKPDIKGLSVDFFFLNCILNTSRDSALSRGLFDHAVSLYNTSKHDSPLYLAVSLLAEQALCLFFGVVDQHAYIRSETAAYQSLQRAISDKNEQLKDETLFTVLALDFAEGLWADISGNTATRAHIEGALAIVQFRGELNHRDEVSKSLLAATRTVALLRALWSTDERRGRQIALLPRREDDNKPGTVMQLHDMVAQAHNLEWAIMRHSIGMPFEARWAFIRAQKETIQDLMRQLSTWYAALPDSWLPVLSMLDGDPGVSVLTIDSGLPIMHTAYTLAQWYCVRLWALKLLCISARDGATTTVASEQASGIVQTLCTIAAFLQTDGLSLGVQEKPPADVWKFEFKRMSESLRPSVCQANYALNIVQWALSMLTMDVDENHPLSINAHAMDMLQAQAKAARSYTAVRRVVHHASYY